MVPRAGVVHADFRGLKRRVARKKNNKNNINNHNFNYL
jgi:hypothetical protein